MAIFLDDQDEFEAGTTISSRVRVSERDGDDNDELTGVDVVDGEPQITLEVIRVDGGETVRSEETMEELLDDDGEYYYIGSWSSSSDDAYGEYKLVHRATVDEEDYRLTRLVELVEVADEC